MKRPACWLLLFALSACNSGDGEQGNNKQQPDTQSSAFTASAESLARHELPRWWDDGKFGVFIHWGVYAVPGVGGREGAVPYTAEWYWFAQQAGPFSEAWQYHLDTYGQDFVYDDFIPQFTAENFDPDAWIELFEDAGARYFVITAKHHDGFALWPSATSRRDAMDMGPGRDLIGELFAASSRAGDKVKPGLYYSIPEWYSPAPYPADAALHYLNPNTPDPVPGLALIAFNGQYGPRNAYTQLPIDYVGYEPISDYADGQVRPQLRELINEYSPYVIWCDIGGAESYFRSNEIIADYYNHALKHNPEGVVVNDRCGDASTHRDYEVVEVSGTAQGEAVTGRSETVQTMGFSWGYDTRESDADIRSTDELVDLLVDIVANNGNLLLNIGPAPDGSIPAWQVERLLGIGEWLKINGEAIYGSKPWTQPAEGELRFTQGADGSFYIIALEWPGESLELATEVPVSDASVMTLLGSAAQPLAFSRSDQKLTIQMPASRAQEATQSQHAYVIRVSP